MTTPRTINIHGREYETVASRIARAREAHPEWSIIPAILQRDETCVLMRVEIREGERLISVGHAEEFRASSAINRTSAVENCETSAIGRALAAAGYIGSEFASLEEVANAIKGKPPARAPKGEPAPVAEVVVEAPPAQPPGEHLEYAGKLLKCVEKVGTTRGKPWTRYGLQLVTREGVEVWCDTFSSGLGAEAQQMVGMNVVVSCSPGERGPRATSIMEVIPF